MLCGLIIMDGNGNMNIQNYHYDYESAMALEGGRLGLQLMPTTVKKPLLGGRTHLNLMTAANGVTFEHPAGFFGTQMPIDYMKRAWNTNQEQYFGALHGNHHPHHYHHSNYMVLADSSSSQHMQMISQPKSAKDEIVHQVEERGPQVKQGGSGAPVRKRSASKTPKSPRAKKPRKISCAASRDESTPSVRQERLPKRSAEVAIRGIDKDISGIPVPVCSCTGTPTQCYRWGSGGWQSACCTTGMSMYPLPMSAKRRGARIAGRKMSFGAFRKVLEKLSSEGYNFLIPIDLRTHWAKHGTNKFVTIR